MAGRRLLVFDSSYNLEAIRQKGLEAAVTCRDLGGFFEKVWTVHAFAGLQTAPERRVYGQPVVSRINDRHMFVEGTAGIARQISALGPVSFFLAQIPLFKYVVDLVKRERISVIRAGDSLANGLWGAAVAGACDIPLVIRVNGNNERQRRELGRPVMPGLFPTRAIEEAVERFVLGRADLVAAVNEDNLKFARAMGVPSEKTTIFRYGNLVAPAHFTDPATRADAAPLLREQGLEGKRFMLCVSRLEPVKMPDHAVEVLSSVRRMGIDTELLLVGGGRMRADLETLAERLGVAEHVKFAGERDQDWLSRVIPRADVVLSPLTGRALSEVALAGAPTVAYDLDWQGELVVDGVTGALVTAWDHAAMAGATARLLQDPGRARSLGSRLRTRALEMMDPDVLDAHERASYRAVLSNYHRIR
jgi:glycosyltransferase involved in cell wall biosynthesis